MYNNRFSAAVKADGSILREFGDTVRIPFGKEFSVLLKNLNSVRAQVSVSIDGESVIGNNKLVINPNEDFDLTRYIKNGNLSSGNRFKFIERTPEIEDFRGAKIDDGIIRITFQFEKPSSLGNLLSSPNTFFDHSNSPWPNRSDYSMTKGLSRSLGGAQSVNNATLSMERGTKGFTDNSGTMDFMSQLSDAGITVPGSVSNQEFRSVQGFAVEPETHVIIIKMVGEVQNVEVTKPITVKTSNKCPTCGFLNNYRANYCSRCSTALLIV